MKSALSRRFDHWEVLMALKVSFGNGGKATQANLDALVASALGTPDTSLPASQALNGGAVQENPTGVGGELSTASVFVPPVAVPGGASGTGGWVDASWSSGAGYAFDVRGGWNSVKNAFASSDQAADLAFKDFVHVDVVLGDGGNSTVVIENGKRGNVATGNGNDTIEISLLANDATWVNEFNVKSGAGNDNIVFTKGSMSSSGGVVGAKVTNGGFEDGSQTRVVIDAGADNDTIDLSDVNLESSRVIGGTGVDNMYASGGNDTFVFMQGHTGTTLGTADAIFGFEAGDVLSLHNNGLWIATDMDGSVVVRNVLTQEKILLDGTDVLTVTTSIEIMP
jgi:hypothetical protein